MTPGRPPLWARLRRWLRPPRTLRVTPAGRICLFVTFGIGVAALNTGNNLLYLMLGFLLSTIVASGVLSERSLRGLAVRRLEPVATYAQEPFAHRWALINPDVRCYDLSLSEEGSLIGEGHLPYLPRGEERIVRADPIAPRRGPLRLTAVKVTTRFPLGLFAKSRRIELTDTVLVFPRRRPARSAPPRGEGSMLGELANRATGGEGDLAGLVDHQEGRDSRRIHWVKSAAAGRLLLAEREKEEACSYVFRVDPTLPSEALDRRCEEIAALSHELLAKGHQVGLSTQERGADKLRPAGGPAQHRRILLALAWMGEDR